MTGGNDDPFGVGDDRTIISPNPGLRRQTTIRPPLQPASTPASQPQRSLHAEDGGDSWITSERPSGAPRAMLARAEDLRFDELVAPNQNPIMQAAAPLLLVLGRLRVAALRASPASLMEQVAGAIDFFDREIRAAGVSSEQAQVSKYLICATADDIVQNIPTEDRHVWTQHSMLSRFFGERIGGVRFFEELERLERNPSANFNVLELQHACLALGFQGVHRTSAGAAANLQVIQRELYETLRRVRARGTRVLSPRWQGQALTQRRSRFSFPIWGVAGVVGLVLFALFLVLRSILANQGDAVAAGLVELHPRGKVTLQRRVAELPVVPSQPAQTQLERIRAQLSDEIAKGLASADYFGKWIAIRFGSVSMFDSGQATVLRSFNNVSDKLAQILRNEAGPIKIVGHTDNQPLSPLNHFQNNQQLSIERANAVAALLRPKLDDSDRLTTDGRGPDDPVADNKTPQGKAKNRRVEVLVTRVDP
jgi:type VI secretion system protein ImpK